MGEITDSDSVESDCTNLASCVGYETGRDIQRLFVSNDQASCPAGYTFKPTKNYAQTMNDLVADSNVEPDSFTCRGKAIKCIWSEWTASSCSVTCGQGEKVFTRSMVSGDENCKGCNTRVEQCIVDKECPVDCQWSEWDVSECTADCGGGTRTKTRTSKLS